MSLLSDYEARTAWKYEPIRGAFHTAESLLLKVEPDGNYVPFAGSTAVFRPSSRCVRTVRLMQGALYHRLDGSGMLAFPLPASTVHMTLHDLVSPEARRSGTAEEYGREIADSLRRAEEIAEGIRRDLAGCRIDMEADRIVSMVAKSLVLMLRPKTERDWENLMEMYSRFDRIRSLPYPLTPHITLAYYRPGVIDGDALGAAVDAVQIRRENAPVFEFYPEALTAQSFLDMESYMDVPSRICFCCDGGLNRSVMAANILNHLAKERNLPVVGEARSAYPDTRGRPVPDAVWATLERHGIRPDRSRAAALYLEDREASHFTWFAAISGGAADRIADLLLPEEKTRAAGRFFYGVRDPEYGEITHEQAFAELYGRAEKALDAFEKEYGKHLKPAV